MVGFGMPGPTGEGIEVWAPAGDPPPFAAAPIAWINLDSRTDRRAWMELLLAGWDGPVERIPAVPASTISAPDLDAYRRKFGDVTARNFRIAGAELACLRSHRKAAQATIDRGRFPAIIFEDDVITTAGWWQARPPAGWDIALLGGRSGREDVPRGTVDGWTRISDRFWSGAWAYAIANPTAALRLVEYWQHEDAAADFAWLRLSPSLAIYGAGRELVAHDFDVRSDIQRGPYGPAFQRTRYSVEG